MLHLAWIVLCWSSSAVFVSLLSHLLLGLSKHFRRVGGDYLSLISIVAFFHEVPLLYLLCAILFFTGNHNNLIKKWKAKAVFRLLI